MAARAAACSSRLRRQEGGAEPPAAARCARKSWPAAPAAEARTYTAEIRSRYETDLSFQVGGKLVSRAVDVGATVKKGAGARAARPDRSAAGRRRGARRGAARRSADLDRARSEEARFRDLLERGLTTRAQLPGAADGGEDRARRSLEQATAELRAERAAARLHDAARRPGRRRHARARRRSAPWSPRASACMSVARPERARSRVRRARQRASTRCAARRTSSVRAARGAAARSTPARVREISPSADPVTRTYQVQAPRSRTPPANLRLGMTVSVTLPQRRRRAATSRCPPPRSSRRTASPRCGSSRRIYTLELRAGDRRALRLRPRASSQRAAARRARRHRRRAPARGRREGAAAGRDAP